MKWFERKQEGSLKLVCGICGKNGHAEFRFPLLPFSTMVRKVLCKECWKKASDVAEERLEEFYREIEKRQNVK